MSLHYFGSKDWLKKYIECILPANLEVLVSPFFGSGRIEYFVASQRPHVEVYGSDNFDYLANFHECIQDDPAFVVSKLKNFVGKKLSRDHYNELIQKLSSIKNKYLKAAIFFVIMHNSYHGKFGSYYVNTPPFTERALAKFFKNNLPNIHIKHSDATKVLSRIAIRFKGRFAVLYLDPPYLTLHENPREVYYAKQAQGDNYDFHISLAKSLKTSGVPFIMSLNDTPRVRELYDKELIIAFPRTYRTNQKNKIGSELLIFGPARFWSEQFGLGGCSLNLVTKH